MRNTAVGTVAALAWLAALPAFGQAARSGGASGGANAQMMQQYQQLSAERVTLKADNDRLKKEADAAAAELATVKKELATLKAHGSGESAELEKAKAATAASEQALAESRRKLEELVARFKETATTLRTVETQRAQLEQDAAKAGTERDACVVRNADLYDLNVEVLTRWERQGFWSRLAMADGFTRLKRTQLENLIDDYRSRAAAIRVRQGGAPAAAATPTQP